jgi:hypothetical protein
VFIGCADKNDLSGRQGHNLMPLVLPADKDLFSAYFSALTPLQSVETEPKDRWRGVETRKL